MTPGLTIIATLIGGSLLGIIGVLIAVPIAATILLLLQAGLPQMMGTRHPRK